MMSQHCCRKGTDSQEHTLSRLSYIYTAVWYTSTSCTHSHVLVQGHVGARSEYAPRYRTQPVACYRVVVQPLPSCAEYTIRLLSAWRHMLSTQHTRFQCRRRAERDGTQSSSTSVHCQTSVRTACSQFSCCSKAVLPGCCLYRDSGPFASKAGHGVRRGLQGMR